MLRCCLLALVLALFVPASARAQAPADEPLLEALTETFKREYLSFGMLTQAVGAFYADSDDGRNGFSLGAARLSLRGTLDEGFSYVMQTDFTRTPVILDARVSYAFSPAFIVNAGMFKAPFSAEFLIPAANIDFVNRATVVNVLAPNRQIGVSVRGRLGGGRLGYRVGVFNGNGRDLGGNDDTAFLYAARLATTTSWNGGRLELGANVAHNETRLPGADLRRLLGGADFRLTHGALLLAAEVITSDFELDAEPASPVSIAPTGFYLTGGYMLVPDRHQLLVRLDHFDPDVATNFDPGIGTKRTLVVLGYNFWPTRATEVQLNYLFPTGDDGGLDQSFLLVNFQVAL